MAAAAAAARRHRRRRIIAGVVIAAMIGTLATTLIIANQGGSTKVASKTTSTTQPDTSTTGPPAESAAGKPCVAVADPLPAGAPQVPVEVGPAPTKLVVKDLKPGNGAEVKATDNLTVNYIGVACSTGHIFDSSYKTGKPASFPLNQVIKGWQDGIPGMKVGGQRLLGIPPDQAYGAQGSPPTIAPDETLWFVVEVVDAKPA